MRAGEFARRFSGARGAPHVALVTALSGLAPGIANAHSFGRLYNLPVPFWLYVYGATAALVLSFIVVAWFVSAPAAASAMRERDLGDLAWLRRLRAKPILRAASVLALLLCIATGFVGINNPYANFNMTFFWIVFVLGFAYLTVLVGDFYKHLNPWRVIVDTIARAWPRFAQGRLAYPLRLGWWPALALYMAFIWIELFAYLKPFSLSVVLSAYTLINLLGVWLIGSAAWFARCEFFAVFFGLIAKMAPLRYAGGRLRLRAPFIGLIEERAGHMSLVVFALFMLSSTAFDGLRETVPWMNLFWTDVYQWLKPYVGSNPVQAYPVLRSLYLGWQTLVLVLSPFLYLALYLAFIGLAKLVARSTISLRELALRFAFSLLPIALVYNVTHYYTLVVTQGVKIVPLLSDPFGFGWNLLGTAGWLRAPIIPAAGVVWHTQVDLIVGGHIVSVYLAHLEALRTFPTPRQATLSQLPMLVLMVTFTTIGLWILAQPIKGGG